MAVPIAPILVELAADTVTVEPLAGVDEYGTLTYGAPVDYRCRVIGRTKMVLDKDGKERLSGATVVFFGEFGLSVNHRYTLPERFSMAPNETDPTLALESRQPQCLAVDRETDENGGHHTTVYFSVARLRGY